MTLLPLSQMEVWSPWKLSRALLLLPGPLSETGSRLGIPSPTAREAALPTNLSPGVLPEVVVVILLLVHVGVKKMVGLVAVEVSVAWRNGEVFTAAFLHCSRNSPTSVPSWTCHPGSLLTTESAPTLSPPSGMFTCRCSAVWHSNTSFEGKLGLAGGCSLSSQATLLAASSDKHSFKSVCTSSCACDFTKTCLVLVVVVYNSEFLCQLWVLSGNTWDVPVTLFLAGSQEEQIHLLQAELATHSPWLCWEAVAWPCCFALLETFVKTGWGGAASVQLTSTADPSKSLTNCRNSAWASFRCFLKSQPRHTACRMENQPKLNLLLLLEYKLQWIT